MLYSLFRAIFRVMFYLFFRLEAQGRENVPMDGPLILCGNHRSNFDPPLLGAPLRRKLHYMAKEELFRIPIFGAIISRVGAFPVKRGGVSKESIRYAVQLLKDHCAMAIFPEGGRSNASGVGKKGAASLAIKSKAVVIPVAIVGNYRLFQKMVIIYGKPIDLSEYEPGSSDQLEAATEKIMSSIRKMIEEQSRLY